MNKINEKIKVGYIKRLSLERHPVYVLGVDYKVKIIYKNIKFTQMDVEDKIIKI